MTNVVSLVEHQRGFVLPSGIAASDSGIIDAEEVLLLQRGFVGLGDMFDPSLDEVPLVEIDLANDVIKFTGAVDVQIGLKIDLDPESKVIGREVLAAYKMLVFNTGLSGLRMRSKMVLWRTVAIAALVGVAVIAGVTYH